jgi:hypothetical protein
MQELAAHVDIPCHIQRRWRAVDMLRVSMMGKRYYSTVEFRRAVVGIVDQIVSVEVAAYEGSGLCIA